MRVPLLSVLAVLGAPAATITGVCADVHADVRSDERAMTVGADALESSRVLVADDDPELIRALERALAPWRLVLVVDREALAAARDGEAGAVTARAATTGARFVVWRERDELVVVDVAQGTTERRPVSPGALDPVHAAAVALTVKTMMRSPPAPGTADTPSEASGDERNGEPATVTATDQTTIAAATTQSSRHRELRLQARLAGRLSRGSQTDLGARGALAVLVRPWSGRSVRLGIEAELGSSTEVSRAGFKGTWRDGEVTAIASYALVLEDHALEPWLGVGVVHGVLDGTEMMRPRRESVTLPLVRAGVIARRQLGAWSVGVAVGAEVALGTPAYMKVVGSSGNPVFEVPGIAGVLGVVVAADLGR